MGDKMLHTYFKCPECGKIDRPSRHICSWDDRFTYQQQRLETALAELDAANTHIQRLTEWRDGWKRTAKHYRESALLLRAAYDSERRWEY